MAYISSQEVRAIREELKAQFGKSGFKFSVRCSNNMKVKVSVLSGKTDFSDLWENKKPNEYGYGYCSINHYYKNMYGKHEEFFTQIEKIIKTAPQKITGNSWYDKSDAQTDYFNVSFYFDISVGQWDKPYIQK
jgi:hypothetical protein